MIHKIFADKPSFKSVEFQPGFNVILAEQDDAADEKDSRNGIGKSSLIEIIHFCLGSDFKRAKTLKKAALNNWTFSIETTIGSRRVTVSRSTNDPNTVIVRGNTTGWPIQPSLDDNTGETYYPVNTWTDLLGRLMFDLPIGASKPIYSPSFRGLISYFIRRGRDAYTKPFEYFRSQPPWQIQVYNAYLLDLSWEYARDWQLLKDKEDDLSSLKTAAERGTFSHLFGSIGELEALKLRLENKVGQDEKQLSTFQVHPQYREIEIKADQLTKDIHRLSNENVSARRLVSTYEASLTEEVSAHKTDIERVYKEAGIVFPDRISKRLEDVVSFHHTVTKNRSEYLKEEIQRLVRSVQGREDKIKDLSDERSKQLEILKTHKALDEFTRLQEAVNQSKAQFEEVKRKIDLLKQFEAGKSAVRIEREELKVRTRRDHDERTVARNRAVSLFNANSEALYNRPGQLIINITENGFTFRIEIERSESDGIQLMEVFCYDLMLAQIWSEKRKGSGFLVHDSTVFADVDERQIARAIETAEQISRQKGFQYICCLNSDKVPWAKFSDGFDLKKFVRLELKDKPPEACLFGSRF